MLYFFLLYVKKKYILDRYEKEKKVIAYYVNNNERIMGQSNKALHEKYEFRDIRRDEIEQAVRIEAICFPPNEACTYEHMAPRIENAPDLFLVAVDRKTGKMAAFLNGLATNREHLTDDFFTDADQHDPAGTNIMLLGLDVLPEYQHQGLARELMEQYKEREQVKGRKKLILTCLPDKVEMYKKFGFKDHGIGDSVWGGEAWHEMDIVLEWSKISFFADLNLHSFDIIIKGIETNPETAGTFNFKEESYYDYLEQPGYS